MTSNRLLQRLLGEDLNAQNIDQPSPQTPPPESEDSEVNKMARELDEPGGYLPPSDSAPPEIEDHEDHLSQRLEPRISPEIQGLAHQWQEMGDHAGVATKLMYTPLTHKHFVDLVFIIGQEAGIELAQLMDELAGGQPDQEGQPDEQAEAPETPPQYGNALRRMTGGGEEEGVI